MNAFENFIIKNLTNDTFDMFDNWTFKNSVLYRKIFDINECIGFYTKDTNTFTIEFNADRKKEIKALFGIITNNNINIELSSFILDPHVMEYETYQFHSIENLIDAYIDNKIFDVLNKYNFNFPEYLAKYCNKYDIKEIFYEVYENKFKNKLYVYEYFDYYSGKDISRYDIPREDIRTALKNLPRLFSLAMIFEN